MKMHVMEAFKIGVAYRGERERTFDPKQGIANPYDSNREFYAAIKLKDATHEDCSTWKPRQWMKQTRDVRKFLVFAHYLN